MAQFADIWYTANGANYGRNPSLTSLQQKENGLHADN